MNTKVHNYFLRELPRFSQDELPLPPCNAAQAKGQPEKSDRTENDLPKGYPGMSTPISGILRKVGYTGPAHPSHLGEAATLPEHEVLEILMGTQERSRYGQAIRRNGLSHFYEAQMQRADGKGNDTLLFKKQGGKLSPVAMKGEDGELTSLKMGLNGGGKTSKGYSETAVQLAQAYKELGNEYIRITIDDLPYTWIVRDVKNGKTAAHDASVYFQPPSGHPLFNESNPDRQYHFVLHVKHSKDLEEVESLAMAYQKELNPSEEAEYAQQDEWAGSTVEAGQSSAQTYPPYEGSAGDEGAELAAELGGLTLPDPQISGDRYEGLNQAIDYNWQKARTRVHDLNWHETQFARKGEEYQISLNNVEYYIDGNSLSFSTDMRELMALFDLAMRSCRKAIQFQQNVLVRDSHTSSIDLDATKIHAGLGILGLEIRKTTQWDKTVATSAYPTNRVSATSSASCILANSGTCGNFVHLAALMVGHILFRHKQLFTFPAQVHILSKPNIDGKPVDHALLIANFTEKETNKDYEIMFDPSGEMTTPIRFTDSRYKNGSPSNPFTCDRPIHYKKWIGKYMNNAKQTVETVIKSDSFVNDVNAAGTIISHADSATPYSLTNTWYGYFDREANTIKDGVIAPPSRTQNISDARSSPLANFVKDF